MLICFPRTVNDPRGIKTRIHSTVSVIFPDGIFIPVKTLSADEHLYVTCKGFHAINVQGICDATNKFLGLVVQ